MIIQNELGEDIEVFTPEEVEAQKQAALDEYKVANPDKAEELATAQAELEKLKGKDMNFGNLREQKEAAEKKVTELLSGMDEKIGASEKRILEGVLKDHFSDTLKALAGGDEELQKKVELQYGRIKDAAGTKDEVAKKLRDAYVLATAPEDNGVLNTSVLSSGGVGRMPFQSGAQKFSADEKAMAQKLASAGGLGQLKDEDFK